MCKNILWLGAIITPATVPSRPPQTLTHATASVQSTADGGVLFATYALFSLMRMEHNSIVHDCIWRRARQSVPYMIYARHQQRTATRYMHWNDEKRRTAGRRANWRRVKMYDDHTLDRSRDIVHGDLTYRMVAPREATFSFRVRGKISPWYGMEKYCLCGTIQVMNDYDILR